MSELHPIYSYTEEELYIVATTGWTSYGDNLPGFTGLKGKYIAALGVSSLSEIEAAKLLPDNDSRSSVPESIRLALIPFADTCLENWMKLKCYIEEAYPGDLANPMVKSAGREAHRKGSNYSWSEIVSMNNSGATFIAEHKTVLEMGTLNMPAAFVTTFSSGKDAFETNYQSYVHAQQITFGGTAAKIAANNNVYRHLIAMLKDGQLIFRLNESKKELFIFSSILSLISRTGISGFKVWLIDSISELPVTPYTAKIQPGDITEIADANGMIEVKTSANLYNMVITAVGYPDYNEGGIRVVTGTMSRKKIKMVKVVVSE